MSYAKIWNGSEWKYNFMGVYNSGDLQELDMNESESMTNWGIRIFEENVYTVYTYSNYVCISVCDLNLENLQTYYYSLGVWQSNFRAITTLYWDINENMIHIALLQRNLNNFSQPYFPLITGWVPIDFTGYDPNQPPNRINAEVKRSDGQDSWNLSDMRLSKWDDRDIAYIITGKAAYDMYYILDFADDGNMWGTAAEFGRPTKMAVDAEKTIINYVGVTAVTYVAYTGQSTLTDGGGETGDYIIFTYSETVRAANNIGYWELVLHSDKVYCVILENTNPRSMKLISFLQDETEYDITTLQTGFGTDAVSVTMVIPEESPNIYIGLQKLMGSTYRHAFLGQCNLNGSGFILTNFTSEANQHYLPVVDAIAYNAEPKRIYFLYAKLIDAVYYPYVGYQDFVFKSQVKYWTGTAWE